MLGVIWHVLIALISGEYFDLFAWILYFSDFPSTLSDMMHDENINCFALRSVNVSFNNIFHRQHFVSTLTRQQNIKLIYFTTTEWLNILYSWQMGIKVLPRPSLSSIMMMLVVWLSVIWMLTINTSGKTKDGGDHSNCS